MLGDAVASKNDDQLTEEEEIGGRVANELDEGFPHHLHQSQYFLCHDHLNRDEGWDDHDDHEEGGFYLGELCPRAEDVGAGVKREKEPNSANLETLIFNGDCVDVDDNDNDNEDDDDDDDDDYDDDDNLQDHVHLPESRKAFVPD